MKSVSNGNGSGRIEPLLEAAFQAAGSGEAFTREMNEVLAMALERAVVDRGALAKYLRCLRHACTEVSRTDGDPSLRQVHRLCAAGLKALPPNQLRELATNPAAIILLRAEVIGSIESSPYWWNQFAEVGRHAMEKAGIRIVTLAELLPNRVTKT